MTNVLSQSLKIAKNAAGQELRPINASLEDAASIVAFQMYAGVSKKPRTVVASQSPQIVSNAAGRELHQTSALVEDAASTALFRMSNGASRKL